MPSNIIRILSTSSGQNAVHSEQHFRHRQLAPQDEKSNWKLGAVACVRDMNTMKDEDNRVREWEIGLPSVAELTPLSHSLISRVLARAFCISSSIAGPTTADVLNASQSTLQLLHSKFSPSFPLPSFDPYSSYESGVAFSAVNGMDESRDGFGVLQRKIDDSGHRSATVSKSSVDIAGHWSVDKGQRRDGSLANCNSGPDFGQPYHWSAQAAISSAAGQYGSLGHEHGGFVGLEAGSESTKGASVDKSRKLADAESEDVDSADGPDGNTARTLKRPRLVWTPQLHKRFVDAVGHLGIRNAVPKTIMQLMNVEGLTRENVASHLQKYRLYLKRMQGLSTEGPSASDPLFASAPLPPNLTPSPHFYSNHIHSKGENGIPAAPFSPPGVTLPRAQGALPSGMMGQATVPGSVQHFVGSEHHPYEAASARVAQRRSPALGEHRELLVNANSSQVGSGSPPHQILSLFPPSGL